MKLIAMHHEAACAGGSRPAVRVIGSARPTVRDRQCASYMESSSPERLSEPQPQRCAGKMHGCWRGGGGPALKHVAPQRLMPPRGPSHNHQPKIGPYLLSRREVPEYQLVNLFIYAGRRLIDM